MNVARTSSQPSHSLATAAHGVLRPAAVASKLFAALCVLCVSVANLPAATVTNLMWDISGNPLDRTVKFYPQSTPQSLTWNGTNVTVMDVQKTVTSTNGAWALKFVGGFYLADFGTVNNGIKTAPVLFLVPPNDTNIYDFNYCANLATNLGTFFWTNSFYTVTNLAGNALVQVTNIAQSVGGGGGGSNPNALTNAFGTNGAAVAVVGNQLAVPTNYVNLADSRAVTLAGSFAGNHTGNGNGLTNIPLVSITGAGNAASVNTNTILAMTGWTFTNFWSLNGTATNRFNVTTFTNTIYNGLYQLAFASAQMCAFTNGSVALIFYPTDSQMVFQPNTNFDSVGVTWVYDSLDFSTNPYPSTNFENSFTAQLVTGSVLAPDSQLTTVAQRIPLGNTLITGSGFNVSGNFGGTITGALSGTFTGFASNSVFYGNAAGATNLSFHSTVFLNWWDEVDTISDSFGSMFVTNNFLNTNTTAFCQAVPPSLTNSFSAFTNAPWLYTNGFVCWLGRGNGTGTNISLFMTLTNYFAAANHPVILNMACSVSGIGAQQQAIGGTTGSAGTDLYKFYPPYSNANPPAMNYPLSISAANTGFRKLVIVGPIGINDCGAMPAINVFTNIYKICLAHKLAGDTVVVVTQPIPWATSHGGVAVTQQQLASNLVNAVNFPADLTIDLAAYSASLNESNSMVPWLGDLLHPSYTTATNWAAFVWRGITNNFAVAQSQINSLGANAYSSGNAGLLSSNAIVAEATNLLSANAYTSGNVATLSSNQVIAMAGGAIPAATTNGVVFQNATATNVTLYAGSALSVIAYGTNAGGFDVIATNSNNAGWAGFTAQADNGNFVTNYVGLYMNNSRFAPGGNYVGSTNDAILKSAVSGNFIFDLIGTSHYLWITRNATNGSQTTNLDYSASAANWKLPLQVNGAGVATNITAGASSTNFLATDSTGKEIAVPWATLPSGGGGSVPNGLLTNNVSGDWTNLSTIVVSNAFVNTTIRSNNISIANVMLSGASNQLLVVSNTAYNNGSDMEFGTNFITMRFGTSGTGKIFPTFGGGSFAFNENVGANNNLTLQPKITLADGIAFASINDANSANLSMEFRASQYSFWNNPINIDGRVTNGSAVLMKSTLNVSGATSVASLISTNGISTYGNKIPNAVSVGASPFTFSNSVGVNLECNFVAGGTASFSITKNGVPVKNNLTADWQGVLQSTNIFVLTYTVAPTFLTNNW